MRSGFLPTHLIIDDGLIPEDFTGRTDILKEATVLSWEVLVACLGVEPRHLQRWRKSTKSCGEGLSALILLAVRIPGESISSWAWTYCHPRRRTGIRTIKRVSAMCAS